MNKKSRILVIDQCDVIGFPLYSKLRKKHYENLIDSSDLDYTNFNSLKEFISATKPEYVILTRNKYIDYNLVIELLVDNSVKKIINFTKKNEPDCIPHRYKNKVITVLFDEIYGDYDNYHYNDASIIPFLIRKIHENMVYNVPLTYIEIDNNRKRNFIHTDDLINIIIHILMNNKNGEIINLKTGSNINIKCLGDLIKEIVGYNGNLIYLDSEIKDIFVKKIGRKIVKLEWIPKVNIRYGIRKTYKNLLDVNKYFMITKLY